MTSQTKPAQSPRTSASHPLQIAELVCGSASGRLGITFCPGKRGESVFGAPWWRDLEADLDVIQAWGAHTVVTLVETHELQMLGVPHLGLRVAERGMAWLHLPVEDQQPPGPSFDRGWPGVSSQLRRLLTDGGRVLVHCRGGLGRAGTVAACVLVDAGLLPGDAITAVRRVRRGAIETAAQESYVRRLPSSAQVNG